MTNPTESTAIITEGSKALFVALVKDAVNWNGIPLFGGNVGMNPADRGHLTHLKKLDLLQTEEDYDDPTLRWVYFTPAGKAIAASLGLDTSILFVTGESREDF